MKDGCDRIDLFWFVIFLLTIGIFMRVVLT